MGLCSICANKSCHWYGSGTIECLDFKPETNAERIRAMSDDEMIEFFGNMEGLPPWCDHPCPDGEQSICRDCLVEWLKQEVK